MVEPSARTTVVVHADCRGELCQAGSSALGTGLDAVHRTGAGDQHTVCWDTIVLGILGYWDTGILGCEISGSRTLFRVRVEGCLGA